MRDWIPLMFFYCGFPLSWHSSKIPAFCPRAEIICRDVGKLMTRGSRTSLAVEALVQTWHSAGVPTVEVIRRLDVPGSPRVAPRTVKRIIAKC